MKYYDALQVKRLLADVRAGKSPVDAELLEVCAAALERELAILEARAVRYRLRFKLPLSRPLVDNRRKVDLG